MKHELIVCMSSSNSIHIILEFITLDEYANNSLWDLTETSTGKVQTPAVTEIYHGISFHFHWQRKTLYYSFNMVIPVVLLMVISMCGFWLPPDCGERISLVITALLSYAVFLIVIMDNTPINSEELPVISKFGKSSLFSIFILLVRKIFFGGQASDIFAWHAENLGSVQGQGDV